MSKYNCFRPLVWGLLLNYGMKLKWMNAVGGFSSPGLGTSFKLKWDARIFDKRFLEFSSPGLGTSFKWFFNNFICAPPSCFRPLVWGLLLNRNMGKPEENR